MRTTVDLPEPVLQNARRRAAERNVTLSEIVTEALVTELNAPTPTVAQPFKLVTFGGPNSAVRPGIDLNKISAIIADEDEIYYRELNERLAREKKS
jgi:hypothetical protein